MDPILKFPLQCKSNILQMEAKDERLAAFSHELESAKQQVLQREKQITELQDKFLQSSVHIMEETIQ